jgi:hypothetical protein
MRNAKVLVVSYVSTDRVIYIGDNVESLRHKISVVAYFDDGSAKSVTDYTISDIEGGEILTSSKKVLIEYRDVKTIFSVSSATSNPNNIMYEWDFTKSLFDDRTGSRAILMGQNNITGGSSNGLFDGVPNAPAWIPGVGVRFGKPSQGALLIPPSVDIENFYNTTIEVDVAAGANWMNTVGEVRLVSFRNKSTSDFYCGIVHNNGIGWRPYNGTFGDVYSGMTERNAVAGHTIGIYITNDGKLKLYVDGVSKGTSSVAFDGSSFEGIMLGSCENVFAANLYIVLITGARIYRGEKS